MTSIANDNKCDIGSVITATPINAVKVVDCPDYKNGLQQEKEDLP